MPLTGEEWRLAAQILPDGLLKTLYMVFGSLFVGTLVGLPLGVVLTITGPGHLKEQGVLHKTLGAAVNLFRSFPFAVLIIALIPFTRFLIGTSLGTTASIVPLSVAAAPFIARVVEGALNEVDRGMIDAAVVVGSTTLQIVSKVLLPEALPVLIGGMTLALVSLIGYSALAGLVGGGGLGQIAIQYGYQRFNTFIMILTSLLLILLVELVQWGGGALAQRVAVRRGRKKR
ncbi:MAG: methionine ABC transporter permease [Chlamydiae bacterium GWC2_50_10]|nr:MAG: methionine ABC transporter permease [Chlamydiae bacterium GWC2_50_10]OGN54840.1 MAG: methionine ABC transporter permease [Chlamydiae bacterium GWF2_49_8]HAZ15294.1 methionine ABC transporter permease [Parachlamydiales bacterium]HCJ83337.1 methionine ABC transporter permease [Parachlamydiales bacterium]